MTAMNTAMTSHPTLERLMVFTGNANPKFAHEDEKPAEPAKAETPAPDPFVPQSPSPAPAP